MFKTIHRQISWLGLLFLFLSTPHWLHSEAMVSMVWQNGQLMQGHGTQGNAADSEPQETSPRPWTVDDVLALESIRSPIISPGGEWIVYEVRSRDLKDEGTDTEIWLAASEGGAPIQLTHGMHADGSPQWAPDESWLAFLSDRGDATQIFGIDLRGGEAWQVTNEENAIGSFKISPDGSRIAFLSSAGKSDAEKEYEKLRGRPMVWDSSYASDQSHLRVAPMENRRAGDAVRLSPDSQFVRSMVWAPDSRTLAWSARPALAFRTNIYSDVYVGGDGIEKPRRVTNIEGGERPVDWVPGLGLVVSGPGSTLDTPNWQLWLVPTDTPGDAIPLTAGVDENMSYVGASEDQLIVEASHRTGRRLYRITIRDGRPYGDAEVLTDDSRYWSRFSTCDDLSSLAFLGETPGIAPEIFSTHTDRFAPRRLTYTNPRYDGLAVGETKVVTWQSRADGEEIEGILTLPVGYVQGDKVPLLLVIHGGPMSVSTTRFVGSSYAYPIPVFSGLGYAVLQPNYRGSGGYGERFRSLNRGDISGRDWIDIDSGVDFLIAEGIADPDKLGVMGWSFGGHHTFWGITQTDRFKAASAGAGANDLISMYSQTDLPEFYHTYLGMPPWENFELYEERSAYRFVNNVTTPLLIQVGERDGRVPAEQSIQFYEAVKGIGKAPTKLVLYPGQQHTIATTPLLRDLMVRNVEWFSQWIPVGER